MRAELLRAPLFWLGLFLRLTLIVWAIPLTQSAWFVPFLQHYTANPSIDPWSSFLASGGTSFAFPYGAVMFLAYLPGVALASTLEKVLQLEGLAQIGFGLSTLIYDLVLFALLLKLLGAPLQQVLRYYWLSPIVIYICYWHGQIDILPVMLFVAALLSLKQVRAKAAGGFLGLAIAAKLNILLAAPFVLVYLWRNSRVRSLLVPFCVALAGALALFQFPALLSSGFIDMALGSPEIDKIYYAHLRLGDDLRLYLLPIVYALVLYGAWRIERMSSELLFALIGVAFFAVLVLTPASSGWYLWVVPFLIWSQLRGERSGALLGSAFSWLFVISSALFSSGADLRGGPDLRVAMLDGSLGHASHLHSLLITGICALGLLISLRTFIYGVRRSDYFRLSRRPLTIAIAGDSGSGKDTLALALAGTFGEHSVTSVSGDDYHKWDRRAPMWQALTHLDPRGNNLHQFAKDILSLVDGKQVLCRRYNHDSGAFDGRVRMRKNDVIIASGLHALYVPQIRDRMDVSVFLGMDEQLRNYLKIKRDVAERGRDEVTVRKSIEKRQPDAQRHVQHQAQQADVVFSLRPADPEKLADCVELSRYKLGVTLNNSLFYEDINKVLIGLCGMQVDFSFAENGGPVEMLVEGDVTADDISAAATELLSDMEELIALEPRWHGGMLGVMQLITMCQAQDSLRSRVVYGYTHA